jgi:hypothetical protein
MSGQPYKYHTDAQRFRDEYMEALNLRANIDDMNHQAVKTFVATGQLPAVSQMKDTRTTTEILADTEKLKINLISDLSPIADAQFAQLIIQTIVKSPLNYDNGLLVFLSQRVDDIVKNLQQIYKYKIKGDANDAEQFVAFINKMFMDKNALAKSTKGFINRSGSIGSFGGYSSDLPSIHKAFLTIASELSIILKDIVGAAGNNVQRTLFPLMKQVHQLIRSISTKISLYRSIIPISNDDIQQLEQTITSIPPDDIDRYAIFDDYKNYLSFLNERLPKMDIMLNLIHKLKSHASSFDTNFQNLYTMIPGEGEQLNRSIQVGLNSILDKVNILCLSLDNTMETIPELEYVGQLISNIQYHAQLDPNRRNPFDRQQPDGSEAPFSESFGDTLVSSDSSSGPPSEGYRGLPRRGSEGNSSSSSSSGSSGSSRGRPLSEGSSRGSQPGQVPGSQQQLIQLEDDSSTVHSDESQPVVPVISREAMDVKLRIDALLDDFTSQRMPDARRRIIINEIRKMCEAYRIITGHEYDKDVVPRLDVPQITYSRSGPPQPTTPERPLQQVQPSTQLVPARRIGYDYDKMINEYFQLKMLLQELKNVYDDGGETEQFKKLAAEFNKLQRRFYDLYNISFDNDVQPPRPPQGSGFSRKIRGRGLQVDHTIGVKPAIKFAPFGKYLLDMSKLKDDTIAMKTMSGTSVVGHPSKKVSTQFSKIVKDMIGGKVPSDEDLSGLSNLEREYLHKVSKKANIEDKFAVATPSKDQYEKDIHSFEVMRGEIVAGNDNQEMIKKFKLLIMKLSRSGSLPKNEVSEILSELAELGY